MSRRAAASALAVLGPLIAAAPAAARVSVLRATWNVRRARADGRVRPWTGDPAPAGGPSPVTGPEEPGPAAVAAVVVAAPAALGVGLLWSPRPARLPAAEEGR